MWSPQQEDALKKTQKWIFSRGPQVFYIAGYAGTGKTTLAQELTRSATGRWLFAAYTGKAAHVLRQKGCDATTIHSLIYRPNGETQTDELRVIEARLSLLIANAGVRYPDSITPEEQKEIIRLGRLKNDLELDSKPRFALWSESPLADLNVEGIVIDECSMVDERLGKDLESFEKKILVLGDPAQLPPVGAGGYFTGRIPDVMLTEVHRHAQDSGILRLATMIRNGESIREFKSCSDVDIMLRSEVDKQDLWMAMMGADQVLVGRNNTRRAANMKHRTMIGMNEAGPMKNDRLVCLKNDHSQGLFNGSQWKVIEANSNYDEKTVDLRLKSDDGISGELHTTAWLHYMLGDTDELKEMGAAARGLASFDWSYALTVHKAQGSQWNDVVLIDESHAFRSTSRKWLYTGVTRAAKKILVVV